MYSFTVITFWSLNIFLCTVSLQIILSQLKTLDVVHHNYIETPKKIFFFCCPSNINNDCGYSGKQTLKPIRISTQHSCKVYFSGKTSYSCLLLNLTRSDKLPFAHIKNALSLFLHLFYSRFIVPRYIYVCIYIYICVEPVENILYHTNAAKHKERLKYWLYLLIILVISMQPS